jgi:hypothetical protein
MYLDLDPGRHDFIEFIYLGNHPSASIEAPDAAEGMGKLGRWREIPLKYFLSKRRRRLRKQSDDGGDFSHW